MSVTRGPGVEQFDRSCIAGVSERNDGLASIGGGDITLSGLEGLLVRVGALESTRRALLEQRPDAAESARRLLLSVRGLTRRYDVPRIRQAIELAEQAPPSELPDALDRLVLRLHELAASTRTRKLEVLIIDDDPDVGILLQLHLSEPNREIFVATSVAEAERIIAERSLSLILLDLQLPDTDGRNLLLSLRDHETTVSIPIFVITASSGESHRAECIGLGAEQYFVKPLDLDLVSLAVCTRLQRSVESLRERNHDSLTGLFNRSGLAAEFDRAEKASARNGGPLSVAIIDLDHFKAVNDTYGHLVGDRVLRRISEVLRLSLRESDIACRWGGEELVVLFPDTDEESGAIAIEKVLQRFRREVFAANGTRFHVTFSAGVSAVAAGSTLEQSIRIADRRLYRAKAAGRDRIVVTDDPESERCDDGALGAL